MTSKVDIWNTALSNIGHKTQITDPDEATAEANHCRRFYPLALGATLEKYAWSFATRRAVLAQVDNPVDHWAFAYALPSGCIKPRAVLPPETTDDSKEQDFAVETDEDGALVLYTNMEDAVLRYTVLAQDTTKYPFMFVLAVAAELSALLVGPIPKDPKKRQEMQQLALYYVGQASANDASNTTKSSSYADFMPTHLRGR